MLLLALILVPLAAGGYCATARSRKALEAANVIAFAATLALAVAVAGQVLASGAVSLWSGFLYADHLSALSCLLTASVALICSIYTIGYMRQEERSGALDEEQEEDAQPANPAQGRLRKLRRYYALTPVFVSAMLLVSLANNLGVMWVAIEGTTLVSVFLVTFHGKKTSLEAAWKYAVIGGVGLSMALFGTVLAYYSAHGIPGAGTLQGLNWSVLAGHAAQLDKTAMRLAFILALLGYGTKAGLAPMHTWKPDVYSESPVPSAAILSSAMLNCAIYGLIRFYVLASRCTGAEFPGSLLLIFGVLSMGIAVPFVLIQGNLRRLLAYSTVDHGGIMAIALGVGGKLGALALMLHMTFHAIAKSLLFLCAGSVCQHFETDLFSKMKGGVLRAMPVTGTVFLIAMLAITGMPPSGLFQSEFLIARASFEAGQYLVTALFVLFGAAIFSGILLHAGRLMLGDRPEAPVARPQPWRDWPMMATAAVLVVIGFWMPTPLLELIHGAARVVTGG
jgi:hydrogenase-4 component F